jgi:hypothetical protein
MGQAHYSNRILTDDTSNPAILQEKETISTYEGSGGKKQ